MNDQNLQSFQSKSFVLTRKRKDGLLFEILTVAIRLNDYIFYENQSLPLSRLFSVIQKE